MDLERASRNGSGTQAESDEENGYSEDESAAENGEKPRKRQRRPMSVS